MNARWLRSNRLLVCLLLAAAVLVTGLLVVVVRQPQGEQAGNSPVFLEGVGDPSVNPFVPIEVIKPKAVNGDAVTQSSPDSAGTDDLATCDPEKLIAYLMAHPEEASAWIQALNSDPTFTWSGGAYIAEEQIPAYIRELTPRLLSDDLRVTNHQFTDGRAIAVQSVLQKGTAVLVDSSGVSRVRCACGNPLTPMVQLSAPPEYVGKPWTDFTPIKIIIINRDFRCNPDQYFDGRQCRPVTYCPPGQYLAPNNRCYEVPFCPPGQVPGPNEAYSGDPIEL
jgi:hypothetical protein